MTGRHATDWEALARREPYFAVLDSDGNPQVGGNDHPTAAFFATGEADVELLFSTTAALLGRDTPLGDVLDFGCGAGRLTLPLARRATRIVATDIAPTMLDHARQNAEAAGLRNITFVESHELDLFPSRFDLICSLLVLQYIPPTAGYTTIRTLLRLLAADGIAALHIPFAPRGGGLRRLARVVPGRSKVAPRIPPATPSPAQPMVATYQYDELTVRRDLEAADVRLLGRFTARIGDANGTVLIARKR